MRTEATHTDGAVNNVLLPGAILLANIDMAGLLEYSLKAAAGGIIWLGCKMAGEYLQRRRNEQEAKTRMNRIRNRKTQKSNGLPE